MSDFYNKYPYTDFHELNLDWVLERVKQLTEDWLATQEAWQDTEEQWQQLHDYVMDYFANLDVQDEINNKINAMIADGTFLNVIRSTVIAQTTTATENWLAAHITQPTTPAIDNTLTIAGAAADAKAAGDGIRNSYQYGDLYSSAADAGANDDLDNIPTGTVYTYNYNPTNSPASTFLGSVITFTGRNGQSALRSQLAFDDNDNVIYYRSKVSSVWSAWIEISQQLKHLGLYYNTDDLNNLVGTCMVICAQAPINTPAAGFIGNVFTFSGSANPAQPNNLTQIACDVQNNNIYIRNKFTAWSAWLQINQPIVLRLNGISGDPIDFDTLRSNTIGTYYGTCTNAPITPFIGTVFTFAGADNQGSNITQIASYFRNGLNRIYIRCKYTAWTAWNELTNKTTSLGQLPATTDLDDMVSGTIALFASAPVNSPTTPFNGNVFTYSGADHVGATQNLTQIATETNGEGVWIRSKYATWGSWVKLNDSGIKYYNNKAFRPIGDFCACGDSLTVSLSVYDDNTYVTVKSWAQYIADDCAGSATVYAQGGITTGGYLASTLFTNACAHVGDAAFIFLGTNDGNQGVSDATYKTNYQAIVDGLLVNHKFVVCISLTKGISYPNYNNAIQEICTNTPNAFYCDITPYADDFLKYKNHGHLSSFGYSALASAIELGLNNMIGDNDSYFQFTFDF